MKTERELQSFRIFGIVLFAMFITVLISTVPVYAREIKTSGGVSSYGSNHQYRGFDYHVVRSYLFKDGENFVRVEDITFDEEDQSIVVAENYSKNYKLLSKKKMVFKNRIFGGAYASEDAYYVLFGYYNPKEDDNKTVFQVVRYDKNWNVLGECNIKGVNTYYPFDAGSARFAMKKNMLFVHTCRGMYKSTDGKHHQSNISFQINTDTMRGNTSPSGLEQYKYVAGRYTSHSFNQFVTVDGDSLVTLDHGDAYPRSLVLRKGPIPEQNEYYSSQDVEEVDLIRFPGESGNNVTNATAGSLEISKNNYMVTGVYNENIYVATVPRRQFNNSNVHVKYITNYTAKDFNEDRDTEYEATHLVKLSETEFMLLWQERYHQVHYVKIDENGNKLTPVLKTNGELSDCKPIVVNGKPLWYYCDDTTPIFCYPVERPVYTGKIKGTVGYSKALSTAKINYPVVQDSKGKIIAGEWKWYKPGKTVSEKEWYSPKIRFVVKDNAHYDNIENEYAELKVTGFNKKKMAVKDHVIYKVISKKKKTACAVGSNSANVKSVTIQNQIKINGRYYKVTKINKMAFAGLGSLKRLTVGKNVRKIGYKAFYGCTSLNNINIKSTGLKKGNLGNQAFSNIGKSVKVKVPKKKKAKYKKIFKKKYALTVS